MGLPKQHRLKKRRDFQTVYRRGTRFSTDHLLLKAWFNSEQTTPVATQIGISISKKVSKKAVVRNRIKRQIRAAVAQLLPLISPGWQAIVIVLPTANECKYEHFLRELKQLLIESKIINGYKRRDDL